MTRKFEYLDGQILCHHTYDGNTEIPQFYMHAHERMELYYLISGNVDYIVEGSLYKLRPGDVVITQSAEVHNAIIHPGAPYERISIQFSTNLIKNIDHSSILLKPFYDRSLGHQNRYPISNWSQQYFVSCFDGFDSPESGEMKRLNIISVLLRTMLGITIQFESISHSDKYPDADGIARKLINYVNRELYSKISLTSISQHFYLSESQVLILKLN